MTVPPGDAMEEPLAAFVAAVRDGRLRGPAAEDTLPYEATVMARRYADLLDSIAGAAAAPDHAGAQRRDASPAEAEP